MNITYPDSKFINLTKVENNSDYSACQFYAGEYSKCVALKYIKQVSATVSIVGTALMLIVIVYFRQFKDFTQRMVIHLCVASLLLGVSFLVTVFEKGPTPLCQCQAAAITFSIWACLLWAMGIVMALYLRVVYEYDLQKKETLVTLLFWTIPVIMSAMPFIGKDVYAPTEVWCWIKNDASWRFGIWYSWHILSVFLFMFAMFRIIWTLHKTKDRHSVKDLSELERLKEDIKTLRRYPFAYTMVSVVAIICRVGNLFSYNSFALLVLFTIFGPFLGLAVAFVFVIDKSTIRLINRKEILRAFRKWTSRDATVKEYQFNAAFNEDNMSQTVHAVEL